MSKMKDLIYDIVEDFQNRVPMTIIAEDYGVPVSFVQEVVELYGAGEESTEGCLALQ